MRRACVQVNQQQQYGREVNERINNNMHTIHNKHCVHNTQTTMLLQWNSREGEVSNVPLQEPLTD